MKFTVSTLFALFVAVPSILAVDLAEPLTVTITTTLTSGSIIVFPERNSVKIDYQDGQGPQQIGELHFTSLGSEDEHFERFDIIDEGEAPGYYTKCKVWLKEDPKLKEMVIEAPTPLAHLGLGLKYDAPLGGKCVAHKNGE